MKVKQQRRETRQESTQDVTSVETTRLPPKYGICRICFRELAYKGEIPGCKESKLVSKGGKA